MWPLPMLHAFPDTNWHLRKQYKTHFNSRKNQPGRSLDWYIAVKNIRAEHGVEPSLSKDFAELMAKEVSAQITKEVTGDTPSTT